MKRNRLLLWGRKDGAPPLGRLPYSLERTPLRTLLLVIVLTGKRDEAESFVRKFIGDGSHDTLIKLVAAKADCSQARRWVLGL